MNNALLRITVKDAPGDVAEVLLTVPGVESVGANGGPGAVQAETRFHLESGPDKDLREAVFRAAVERGWVLLELVEEKASLEDVFVREARGAAAPAVGEVAPEVEPAAPPSGSPGDAS